MKFNIIYQSLMNKLTLNETNANSSINPDEIKEFYNKENQDNGIVTYWVEDSKAGQIAVRKIVDQYWGYKSNPWKIIARQNIPFSQQQLQQMTEEQIQKLDLYSDKYLKSAWFSWHNIFNRIPKRIAFKNNQLYAFSYNDNKRVIWKDKNNKGSSLFPDSKIKDQDKNISGYKDHLTHISSHQLSEEEILKIVDRNNLDEILNLIKNYYANFSIEIYNKLIDKNNIEIMSTILEKKHKIPLEILEKMFDKGNYRIKQTIARRDDISKEMVQQLAQNEDPSIRAVIATRNDLPLQLIKTLAEDNNSKVRAAIAWKRGLSKDIIKQLAEDSESEVRWQIANRPDLTSEIIDMLINDENPHIREKIQKEKNLRKVIDDLRDGYKRSNYQPYGLSYRYKRSHSHQD